MADDSLLKMKKNVGTEKNSSETQPKNIRKDNLDPGHVHWLIESKAQNQFSALKLYDLIQKHQDVIEKNIDLTKNVQDLVSISFSLWRAVFLADREGKLTEIIEDAKTFLGRILIDNAINFAQDRASREWSFNFYLKSANFHLNQLPDEWTDGKIELFEAKKSSVRKDKAKNRAVKSQYRWSRHQAAFDSAVERFSEVLNTSTKSPKRAA